MKFIIKYHYLIVLTLIIFLGGLLRFWNLGTLPVSLNWDEVSHGYNAYSILKTGMDEWGKPFPLIFRAFGDYKLPLYIYLTVIPVWLLGLSAFSVRFISALAGTLAIPGIYLLARELFPNKKYLPIIAALLLAISPWHFFISRPALEANLALTLIIFGFYFLLKFFNSIPRTNHLALITSVVLLGLSLHTYNTARVFVPLMVIATFIVFRTSFKKLRSEIFDLRSIISIFLVIFFSGLVVLQVISGEGSARYEKLKILSPSVVFQIGEARSKSTLPPLLVKMILNRPVTLAYTATKNYLRYFSPQFFYQTWGAQFQFAIPGQNLLTLPAYLLSILGLLFILTKLKENKSHQFLLAWLLLSPIAASLTADPPQALRPIPMIPVLIIMSTLGIFFLYQYIPKKYTAFVIFVTSVWVTFSFASYIYNYNTEYKLKYSSSWQYGYSQVMKFIKDHGSEYERIFITKRYGEPHIFYSFYTRLDPSKLQPGTENIRFPKSDWFWTDKIGNVYFINDWQIPKITIADLPLESGEKISTARSLLITSPDHLPVNAHVIETINFLDGTPAFIITSVP